MGGRHKNFEDPMLYELRNRGNKVLKLYIFYGPPFRRLLFILASKDLMPSTVGLADVFRVSWILQGVEAEVAFLIFLIKVKRSIGYPKHVRILETLSSKFYISSDNE
jgi:hypothetical protein